MKKMEMSTQEQQKQNQNQIGIILDFDGVLAIPYTDPVELYSQIPKLLAELSQTYILVLASFNPTAIAELRRLGVLHYFQGVRAGSHDNIEFITYVQNLGRLCKAAQIESLQTDTLSKCARLYFFDDDATNIAKRSVRCRR